MVFQNNVLAGGAGGSGTTVHTIDQSIRFNAGDSPKMTRTPSGAGNRKTWTFSTWVKRGVLSTDQWILGSFSDTSNFAAIYLDGTNNSTDNTFRVYEYNGGVLKYWVYGSHKFRDPSAWYHFVVSFDSTNAISSERIKLYVNGLRITDLAQETQPSLNYDSYVNATIEHRIGEYNSKWYMDGYLAEIVLIDGTALDPSSFGEYNSSNIWIPKDVSGLTFGTNGFHIDGRDSSDLGDDESGNGNDYTTSGLASDDQKSDSPTNNHTTWNPLTTSAQAYSNGNLNSASSSSSWKGGLTTAQVPLNSGTWYYEIYVDSAGASSGQFSIGWAESNRSVSDDNSSGDTEGWVTYAINGNYYANGGTGSYGATYTTGDVIGCKIDTDSSTNNVEFYKNGVSQGTISQAFNTGGTGFISPYILLYATRNGTARFAQAEWTQTPSGITEANAINTTNLGS